LNFRQWKRIRPNLLLHFILTALARKKAGAKLFGIQNTEPCVAANNEIPP